MPPHAAAVTVVSNGHYLVQRFVITVTYSGGCPLLSQEGWLRQ